MPEHLPEERIPANIDISRFFEFYKLARIGLQGMSDEIDKAVLSNNGNKRKERRTGIDRRKFRKEVEQ